MYPWILFLKNWDIFSRFFVFLGWVRLIMCNICKKLVVNVKRSLIMMMISRNLVKYLKKLFGILFTFWTHFIVVVCSFILFWRICRCSYVWLLLLLFNGDFFPTYLNRKNLIVCCVFVSLHMTMSSSYYYYDDIDISNGFFRRCCCCWIFI